MASVTFHLSSGAEVRLAWNQGKGRPVVILSGDDDWDYEDEAETRDMSREIRLCRTLSEAEEVLGIGG